MPRAFHTSPDARDPTEESADGVNDALFFDALRYTGHSIGGIVVAFALCTFAVLREDWGGGY